MSDNETSQNGIKVCAEYRRGKAASFDFHELMYRGPGQLMAIVGCVAQTGVPGSAFAMSFAAEVRRVGSRPMAPTELLEQLNLWTVAQRAAVTAVCVELDVPSRRIMVANAGHVLPIVRRASGAVNPLSSVVSAPLGTDRNTIYRQDHFPLDVGDVVLLLTGGLLEALQPGSGSFGMWSFLEILGEAPAGVTPLSHFLFERVDAELAKIGGAERNDLTLLALQAAER